MIKTNHNNKSLVIDILCKSFDANNSVNYVVKQDNHRKQRIRDLMDYCFEVCSLFGEIILSDDKKACALILFPDRKKVSIRSIKLDIKLAYACVGVTRVLKILNRDLKIKGFHPKHPIYYLWFIGVDPNSQHQGIGRSLLNEIMTESKAMQRPIYLETSMIENVKFYEKAGFEIYHELDFGHKLFLIKKEII